MISLHQTFQTLFTECLRAVRVYSPDSQHFQATEEMGELLLALNKCRRNRNIVTELNVIEESADVVIMAVQMALLHGSEGAFLEMLTAKMDKMSKRLDEYER